MESIGPVRLKFVHSCMSEVDTSDVQSQNGNSHNRTQVPTIFRAAMLMQYVQMSATLQRRKFNGSSFVKPNIMSE